MMWNKKIEMPTAESALPGRGIPVYVPGKHFINQHSMANPYPDGYQKVLFGMGCFWGAEKSFWNLPGVYVTAVGYSAGFTPNPTYQEVCSGLTGHNEVVMVIYDPNKISFDELLKNFWESHNPTQGMRQGNDTGTQYRSGIYCSDQRQMEQAKLSLRHYQHNLSKSGLGDITTEILPMPEFYFAEEYHQQYLAKNPGGYCGLGGTGVPFKEGVHTS